MTTAPELLTDRLLLRQHRQSDFAALHRQWSDPENTEHITGKASTEAESWTRLLRYAGHWNLLGFGYWAICRKDNGCYLGEAGFLQTTPPDQDGIDPVPEAGWILGKEHTGMGYGLEAVSRILHWADAEANWAKTECVITQPNLRSAALACKLGYQKTGPHPEREVDSYTRFNPHAK